MLRYSLFFSTLFFCEAAFASHPSLEVAPTFLHLDYYDCTELEHQSNKGAVQIEGQFPRFYGYSIRPYFLGGCDLFRGGVDIGYPLPLSRKVLALPLVGVCYTSFSANIHFPMMERVGQKLMATTPYFGVAVCGSLFTRTSILASCKYGKSLAKLKTKGLPGWTFATEGFDFDVSLQHAFSQRLFLRVGVSSIGSLRGEREGMTIAAVRGAIGYNF